ncbi:MAG: hypothetical protein JSW46_04925 [Gemmatimonadota bacterium]|nr:MAG: hypothetical protein JSW46_04925 [Gemmatimonadota bacterium]
MSKPNPNIDHPGRLLVGGLRWVLLSSLASLAMTAAAEVAKAQEVEERTERLQFTVATDPEWINYHYSVYVQPGLVRLSGKWTPGNVSLFIRVSGDPVGESDFRGAGRMPEAVFRAEVPGTIRIWARHEHTHSQPNVNGELRLSYPAFSSEGGQLITFRTITPLADCGLLAIEVKMYSYYTDPRGQSDPSFRRSQDLDSVLLEWDETEYSSGQLIYPAPEERGDVPLFSYWLDLIKDDGSTVRGRSKIFDVYRQRPVLIGSSQVEGAKVSRRDRVECSSG